MQALAAVGAGGLVATLLISDLWWGARLILVLAVVAGACPVVLAQPVEKAPPANGEKAISRLAVALLDRSEDTSNVRHGVIRAVP